jgi:hypothetical protein
LDLKEEFSGNFEKRVLLKVFVSNLVLFEKLLKKK